MSQYDELLAELETLQKAYSDEDGDKKIAAASHPEPDDDNMGGPSDYDEDNEDDDEDDDDDEEGFKPIAKSFAFELDNGQTVEAVDATSLIKSLTRKLNSTESLLAKSIDERDALNSKVLKLLKSQSAELDGLRKQVAKLAGEGRGRKAVVNVHEAVDAPMAKAHAAGDLLAKAHSAAESGRITWKECAEVDASLRLKQLPNQAILAKLG